MTDSTSRKSPRWLDTLIVVLAVASLVACATLVMFSAFMSYDDEGYVLLSLRNFTAHGGLYRDVYSQYGPFPFVFYYLLDALGFVLTHTTGRLLTLGAWTGTAVACMAVVGFVTRSMALRLAVLAGVFAYLWVMASEPTHPGGLIVLLTTVLGALGYWLIVRDHINKWAVLVGAVAAMLLLTKINIGIFAVFSAGTWLLLYHRNTDVRRWAPALVGIACVLLPLALMRSLIGMEWVQTYAFTFAASGIAVVIASTIGTSPRIGWQSVGIGLLAAMAVVAIVFSVVLARRTTPADLMEGMVLAPLRHPGVFSLQFHWPVGARVLVAISMTACIAATLLRRRALPQVELAIAVLRIAFAIGMAAILVRYPQHDPANAVFALAPPWLWLLVWPLSGESAASSSGRTWMALLLLGQCLHAFPVPGSQVAWGSVLALPLAAIGAWEAMTWITRNGAYPRLARRANVVIAQAIVVTFAVTVGWRFAGVAARYRDGQYLAQPGAEMIRIPDTAAALYRLLTLNASVHADMLFSLPGMFSLNIWTGLPTPTYANVTHWFSLLDGPRQQAIVDALEAHPRACIIIDRGHVDFLKRLGFGPRGLVLDYIAKNFEPAFVADRFEFCVRRGRHIEPFLVGDLLTRVEPEGRDKSAKESTLLKFNTLLTIGRPVANVELTTENKHLQLDATNARVEIAPVNRHGEIIGRAQPQDWPFTLKGPSLVYIYFDREGQIVTEHGGTLVLHDSVGDEVALALLRR